MKENVYAIAGNENGYIVIETIGVFTPFVLLIVSILSLVNIVALQARVHHAITQAASTVSMYSYVLETVGIAGDLMTMGENAHDVASEANAMMGDINSVISGINSLPEMSDAVRSAGNAAERALGWAEETVGDPQHSIQMLMNYGVNELRGQAFESLVRPLVGRYLTNGNRTGGEYLDSMGVVNRQTGCSGLDALEFFDFENIGTGNSELIDRNGNIKLVVQYEVMYTFGGLPLPFSPTLRITQSAVTKAWLGGSGEGYE